MVIIIINDVSHILWLCVCVWWLYLESSSLLMIYKPTTNKTKKKTTATVMKIENTKNSFFPKWLGHLKKMEKQNGQQQQQQRLLATQIKSISYFFLITYITLIVFLLLVINLIINFWIWSIWLIRCFFSKKADIFIDDDDDDDQSVRTFIDLIWLQI